MIIESQEWQPESRSKFYVMLNNCSNNVESEWFRCLPAFSSNEREHKAPLNIQTKKGGNSFSNHI